MADNTGGARADVELRLPAEGAYATIVRTTAAGLAARLDFTIGRGSMTVELEAEAMDNPPLDTESFAWQVLDTMAQDATAGSEDGRFRVRFTVTSAIAAGMTGAEL